MSDQDPLVEALDKITNLITSPGWSEYLKVLRTHKQYLQEEVNRSTRVYDLNGAIKSLAKMDDIDKQVKLFESKRTAIKQKV